MSQDIQLITTHVLDAQDRLLEQYKNLADPENLIAAFVEDFQDEETAGFALLTAYAINDAVGVQLDAVGARVGVARTSSDDDVYRLEILAKVVKNVSEGSIEDLISVYKFLTGASRAIFQDLYPANLYLQSDGSILPGLANANPIFDLVQQAAPAGVEVSFLGFYDPTNPFSMDGTIQVGTGFGSVNDPSAGGEFAHLIQRNDPFSFDGDDETTKGFASVKGLDPIIGGNFQGL